jgi:hypothetical protein
MRYIWYVCLDKKNTADFRHRSSCGKIEACIISKLVNIMEAVSRMPKEIVQWLIICKRLTTIYLVFFLVVCLHRTLQLWYVGVQDTPTITARARPSGLEPEPRRETKKCHQSRSTDPQNGQQLTLVGYTNIAVESGSSSRNLNTGTYKSTITFMRIKGASWTICGTW